MKVWFLPLPSQVDFCQLISGSMFLSEGDTGNTHKIFLVVVKAKKRSSHKEAVWGDDRGEKSVLCNYARIHRGRTRQRDQSDEVIAPLEINKTTPTHAGPQNPPPIS